MNNKKIIKFGAGFLYLTIILILLSNFSTANNSEKIISSDELEFYPRTLIWSIQIQGTIIEEPTIADQVFIEERDDATDGPPGDSVYDVQDPGTPPGNLWLNMWLDDNLPSPKNVLQRDARFGPDTYKVFNLTSVYSNLSFPATHTLLLSWNNLAFQGTEYDYAVLTDGSFTFLTNMMTSSVYTQTTPVLAPQYFHMMKIHRKLQIIHLVLEKQVIHLHLIQP